MNISDGEPVAGAVVVAEVTAGDGGRRGRFFRVTDADGRYHFRLDADSAVLRAAGEPPSGYAVNALLAYKARRAMRVDLRGDIANADLQGKVVLLLISLFPLFLCFRQGRYRISRTRFDNVPATDFLLIFKAGRKK